MRLIISAIQSYGVETLKWLFFNLLGGLIPVWGGMLMLRLYSTPFGISTFSNNGEFALYSAGMLAPSCYLLLKDYKKPENNVFIYRSFFASICIVGLLISGMLFAGVISVNTFGKEKLPFTLDTDFLRNSTLVLYIVSIIVSCIVMALDSYRISPKDIKNERKNELERLGDEFDKLEDKENGK